MTTLWKFSLGLTVLWACDVEPSDPYEEPKNTVVGDVLCEEAKLHSDFTWIQANVIEPNCVATLCHSSDSTLEHVDLHLEYAYRDLLFKESEFSDLPLVDPGSPQTSYLLIAMLQYGEELLETRQMPLTTTLCQPMLDSVVRWIQAGALND